ncbi:MAG: RNA polymerase sigma factor RpoH [Betaproteobacteria bacterium]|jgi:RNA polymerase sigma-32 factor|nr:RNA polymerase sigma factor RpoH [Nitrosomonadales bacterium]NCV38231.1 RNA polymerase sigma factor RpoH [Betaproteobacteria bacterium]NCV53569.1 RNA polymerase sigma factor RpoH [Betaproteobacteria bacterium]NCW62880.1 RNA polymerase sigma factor RpoH [Betaproteobacteria bacterium]NCX68205.1 RNA polymerase sigma factor RpoH [Betaproteobacteria bacterium]
MNNALTIPLSPSLDSFDLYQQQVQAIPLLTEEEEIGLAKKLHEENDLTAARQLIMSHLRLVIKIARSYSGYGLNQADLVQEGNIGLMKAVKRFDPSRGVRLVSFAIYWIKAEIQEFVVRNWRLVKTATTKAQRKLFFNLRSMKKTLQPLKQDEIKEIAKELNVKEADVKEMEYRFNGNEIALDYQDDDNEDEIFRPISYLKDENADPLKQLISKESESNSISALTNAIKSIDERSRYVLESRWLNEEKSKTLHELADELGVSAERIRQIEQNALKKLKSLM